MFYLLKQVLTNYTVQKCYIFMQSNNSSNICNLLFKIYFQININKNNPLFHFLLKILYIIATEEVKMC